MNGLLQLLRGCYVTFAFTAVQRFSAIAPILCIKSLKFVTHICTSVLHKVLDWLRDKAGQVPCFDGVATTLKYIPPELQSFNLLL
jgi:hypothetical protein